MSQQEAPTHSKSSNKLSVREITIFGMLGGIMYASKALMEFAPNVHFIGVFIVAMTVVYRWKALYPLYTFVFVTGLVNGFNLWWGPYLYIWAVLWGAVMLLPKKMPGPVSVVVYCVVCGLHGYLYGTLYSPYQAIVFHMDFERTIAWIVAGLPWDAVHGTSNLIVGLLITPLITLLKKAERYRVPNQV